MTCCRIDMLLVSRQTERMRVHWILSAGRVLFMSVGVASCSCCLLFSLIASCMYGVMELLRLVFGSLYMFGD